MSVPQPRFCNNFSFAKLPFFIESLRTEKDARVSNNTETNYTIDIGIVGIPFDSGCSFKTGARFGPSAIRTNSCILREYNIAQKCYPFKKKIMDFGDIAANIFDIPTAVKEMETSLDYILTKANKYVILGGDHTISYPSLKAINKKYGKCSLIHFDSHLDTFDNHFGCTLTHGTPFKRAIDDDLLTEHKYHIGLRGGTYSAEDIEKDKNLGFEIIPADYADKNNLSLRQMIQYICEKIKDTNVYVSIDIDVIDPAFAPATGTPEVGGFTSREFLGMIRELKGLNIVGADIVEIAPCYDTQANITSLLGATLCYELLGIM